jgi:hypothetical protein
MNWQCDAQRIYCSLSYMEHDDARNTWRKSCGLEQERWGRHWVGSGKFRSAYLLSPWNFQHNFLLTEWDLMALNKTTGDGVGLALACSGQHIHFPLKFPTEFLAYGMGPRIGNPGWVKPVMQNASTMQTIHLIILWEPPTPSCLNLTIWARSATHIFDSKLWTSSCLPSTLLFPFGILQFNIFQFGLQLGFDPSILQLGFSSIMDATDPSSHCAPMLFPEAFYNSFLN